MGTVDAAQGHGAEAVAASGEDAREQASITGREGGCGRGGVRIGPGVAVAVPDSEPYGRGIEPGGG